MCYQMRAKDTNLESGTLSLIKHHPIIFHKNEILPIFNLF